MKKLVIVAVAVFVVAILLTTYCDTLADVDTFSVDDYASKIEHFPGNGVYGKVETPQEAIRVAHTVWNATYEDVCFYAPYHVFYDDANCVWLVRGSRHLIFPAGPYVLISKENGEILAVWNEKF